MRYIRFFALAHELGHLLSVPAYLGVNGLNFYSDQEIEDFNLTSLEDAGRGHRFDEYSLENYPFIDELRNYAAYGTEGLRYIYANPEQRGKILESVQQATTLLVDEGYTLNTLNREEYENFRKDRLLESIYLGNALQTRHAVLEKNLAEDQNWGPIFEQANCYIDEVMADHFAIKAVEKKVQENERANASPDKISPWAWSGYALFYWFKTINGSGWKSDVGKCTDAHLSFNRRLLLIKSSDILKKYITDRTAEEEFGAGAGDGRAL